ncbi:MAG: pyruvate kinase [Candidatus Ozemobacteraceae bacterium]
MRKTKILVTLGPSAEQEDVLKQLIDAGMNVARLNFSHGDYEEHGIRVTRLKKVREEMGRPIAMMLDTKGPEIRAGNVENGSITLEAGRNITLTTEEVLGTPERLTIRHPGLPRLVSPGSIILLDDGLIQLDVIQTDGSTEISCLIRNSGRIKDKRGVNVPRVHIDLPNPTPKDVEDIRFAAKNGFDFIAVSFTESADTVRAVKKVLQECGAEKIKVIAKIENHSGLRNFDTILEIADGVMVARGDLGVEMAAEEVPIVQKEIIRKCYMAGKPVITATQMLHSMTECPRPTRAEVSDVANAIYDFTSAVMLSGETSVGKYPIACVEFMARVAERAEQAINYKKIFFAYANHQGTQADTTSAVTNAAITTAYNLGAKAIITVSESGHTAQMLSRLRPEIPIIAVVSDERVHRQLSINWGVMPVLGAHFRTLEELHVESIKLAVETGLVREGDVIILVAGIPVGFSGATNMIKVETVGEHLGSHPTLPNKQHANTHSETISESRLTMNTIPCENIEPCDLYKPGMFPLTGLMITPPPGTFRSPVAGEKFVSREVI